MTTRNVSHLYVLRDSDNYENPISLVTVRRTIKTIAYRLNIIDFGQLNENNSSDRQEEIRKIKEGLGLTVADEKSEGKNTWNECKLTSVLKQRQQAYGGQHANECDGESKEILKTLYQGATEAELLPKIKNYQRKLLHQNSLIECYVNFLGLQNASPGQRADTNNARELRQKIAHTSDLVAQCKCCVRALMRILMSMRERFGKKYSINLTKQIQRQNRLKYALRIGISIKYHFECKERGPRYRNLERRKQQINLLKLVASTANREAMLGAIIVMLSNIPPPCFSWLSGSQLRIILQQLHKDFNISAKAESYKESCLSAFFRIQVRWERERGLIAASSDLNPTASTPSNN